MNILFAKLVMTAGMPWNIQEQSFQSESIEVEKPKE